MDEKRLAELLKDVVADTPPATFTRDDVTAASARETRRHRNGLLAGSAFGVAVLAGATALGVALWTGPGVVSDTTSAESGASGGNGNAAPNELPIEDAGPEARTERGESQDSSTEMPKQGGYPTEEGGTSSSTSTPRGCEKVDRELAAALAGELPAAANVKVEDAVPVGTGCPTGGRGAAFNLPEGQLTVVLLPSDQLVAASSDTQYSEPTGGGRQVVVSIVPAGGGGEPYLSRLDDYAATVARLY